jgi:hypothetical protein
MKSKIKSYVFIYRIKEWNHDLFKSQNEIIIKTAEALDAIDKNIRLYLRFHPNLKGLSSREEEELNQKKLNNLVIIPPESNISTYALMFNSDKILSFGSRTSIEAAFWGKPSIIYGKSFYHTLSSLYVPSSFEELIGYLSDKSLKRKQSSDYNKAALFLKERGNRPTHIVINNKNDLRIKNELFKVPKIKLLKYILLYLPKFTSWVKLNKILNKSGILNLKIKALK